MRKMVWLAAFAAASVASAASAQQCASFPNTLTNGSTADANQVMANFNCAALLGNANFGQGTEKLSLNSGGLGFNRNVINGAIYSTGGYAYEFYHTPSTTAGSDGLALSIFTPSGTLVTGGAITFNGNGQVGIGTGSPHSGWGFDVDAQAGGASSWATYSDARLKTNVTTITDALSLVKQLRGVRFNWLPAGSRGIGNDLSLPVDHPQVGFIAQEVERVVPEAVVHPQSADGFYGVQESKIIPLLVEAIKEQQAEIDALKAQLAGK